MFLTNNVALETLRECLKSKTESLAAKLYFAFQERGGLICFSATAIAHASNNSILAYNFIYESGQQYVFLKL